MGVVGYCGVFRIFGNIYLYSKVVAVGGLGDCADESTILHVYGSLGETESGEGEVGDNLCPKMILSLLHAMSYSGTRYPLY